MNNNNKRKCPNCGSSSFPDNKFHDMTQEEGEKIRFECEACWEDFPESQFTETVGTIEFTEEESEKVQEKIEEHQEILEQTSGEERMRIILGIVEEVKGEGTVEGALA